MYTEVLDGRVLKFNFDDIHLPDSNANEVASHGYVIFEIAPMAGLADGTVLENTSEIYFDFNPAVVTNTTVNTLVEVIPSCFSSVTELTDYNEFTIFPNPTNNRLTIQNKGQVVEEVQIIDLAGKIIKSTAGNITHVDVGELQHGIYFIRLMAGNKTVTRKFVKN